MNQKEKADVDELVGAVARLALYLVDELEPTSSGVLERDLDDLYELAVAVERKARVEGRLIDA